MIYLCHHRHRRRRCHRYRRRGRRRCRRRRRRRSRRGRRQSGRCHHRHRANISISLGSDSTKERQETFTALACRQFLICCRISSEIYTSSMGSTY